MYKNAPQLSTFQKGKIILDIIEGLNGLPNKNKMYIQAYEDDVMLQKFDTKFDKKKIIVDIDALLERSVGSEGLLDLYCSCHFINYGTSELNVVRLLVQASAPPCSL